MMTALNTRFELLDLIQETLEALYIRWWVDAGTLLGFVRDGDFLAWENDIDIGCFKAGFTQDKINKLIAMFRLHHCHVNVYDHFISIANAVAVADIKLYVTQDGYAVEPKRKPKHLFASMLDFYSHCLTTPYGADLKANAITSRRLRRMAMRTVILGAALTPNKQSVANWCQQRFQTQSDDVTERLPLDFFDELTAFDVQNRHLPVPQRYEDYLAYRYGDWQTPKQDWVTERDDGACR